MKNKNKFKRGDYVIDIHYPKNTGKIIKVNDNEYYVKYHDNSENWITTKWFDDNYNLDTARMDELKKSKKTNKPKFRPGDILHKITDKDSCCFDIEVISIDTNEKIYNVKYDDNSRTSCDINYIDNNYVLVEKILKFKDLRAGDVFVWRSIEKNSLCKEWSKEQYEMINPALEGYGNSKNINSNSLTYFSGKEDQNHIQYKLISRADNTENVLTKPAAPDNLRNVETNISKNNMNKNGYSIKPVAPEVCKIIVEKLQKLGYKHGSEGTVCTNQNFSSHFDSENIHFTPNDKLFHGVGDYYLKDIYHENISIEKFFSPEFQQSITRPEFVEITLNEQYTAKVYVDKIVVGCQTFDIFCLEQMQKAHMSLS